MMTLELSTPALLFPAISLLLLAYTNRFLTVATVIRNLHSSANEFPEEIVFGQVKNLRFRVKLIKLMQLFGVFSFFLCVLCMFLLFQDQQLAARVVFNGALTVFSFSLLLSLWEVYISADALDLHLKDLDRKVHS